MVVYICKGRFTLLMKFRKESVEERTWNNYCIKLACYMPFKLSSYIWTEGEKTANANFKLQDFVAVKTAVTCISRRIARNVGILGNEPK